MKIAQICIAGSECNKVNSRKMSRASTKIIHELLWEVSFPEWLAISIHGRRSIPKGNKRFIIGCDDVSCMFSWTIPHQSSVPKDGSVSVLGMSRVVSCFSSMNSNILQDTTQILKQCIPLEELCLVKTKMIDTRSNSSSGAILKRSFP